MNDTFRGSLWMIGAIFAFTSMAIAGRAVSFELDTFEIMMYRSFIGIVVVVSVARIAGTLGEVNTRNLAFMPRATWRISLGKIAGFTR